MRTTYIRFTVDGEDDFDLNLVAQERIRQFYGLTTLPETFSYEIHAEPIQSDRSGRIILWRGEVTTFR